MNAYLQFVSLPPADYDSNSISASAVISCQVGGGGRRSEVGGGGQYGAKLTSPALEQGPVQLRFLFESVCEHYTCFTERLLILYF